MNNQEQNISNPNSVISAQTSYAQNQNVSAPNPYMLNQQINNVQASNPYASNQQMQTPRINVSRKPKELQHMAKNFNFYGLASFFYAIFYTFCLYKNASGITAPFFVLGTLCFVFLCLRKSGVTFKKDGIFYMIAMQMIGINMCTTKDGTLLFFDSVALILLLLSGMLHQIYDDREWNFGRYCNAILQSIFGAIIYLFQPFADFFEYRSMKKTEAATEKKNGNMKYVFLGILCGLPLVAIILALLGSADLIFGDLLHKIMRPLSFLEITSNIFGIGFMFLCAFFCSYALYCRMIAKTISTTPGKKPGFHPVVAITINAMLGSIYLVFSVIQILYLFMGNLELPGDYTYAEYARQGFFQLLFVCLINLILVLICLCYFRVNKALKAMLTLITGCTFIMIVSSWLRMQMYIRAYQLSYLRLLTLWMLAVLFLVMSGILIYIFREKFPLFRYSMVVVTVLFLLLAYAHPDRVIATYNLNEDFLATEETRNNIDIYYLHSLSVDAIPVLIEAAEKVNDDKFTEVLVGYDYWGLEEKEMTLRTFNFSLWKAKLMYD